jgi:phosphatidate phosphatase PAH1
MANNDDLLQENLRQLQENLRQLCALTSQIADVEERLTAQQSQLSSLQQEQGRVQEEQQRLNQQLAEINTNVADIAQKQLLEQEKLRLLNELQLEKQCEIAINTQKLAVEAHIQTLNQQQTEVSRQRQQSLKNTFFTVRQTLDEYTANPQPLR